MKIFNSNIQLSRRQQLKILEKYASQVHRGLENKFLKIVGYI